MTDNQRKAIDELTKYREAQKDIVQHRQQIEVIEAKINRSTRACDSIMQQTFVDGDFISVPVVVQTSCQNSAEDLIDTLIEMRVKYYQMQQAAERLCMDIAVRIGDRCDMKGARVLRSLYLYGQSLEQVAVTESYSYRHVKRVRNQALEKYGEKMGCN